jgi:hypothetical protein
MIARAFSAKVRTFGADSAEKGAGFQRLDLIAEIHLRMLE